MNSRRLLCFCHFDGSHCSNPDGSSSYCGGSVEGFMVDELMSYEKFVDEVSERSGVPRQEIVIRYSVGLHGRPPIRMLKEVDYLTFLQFNNESGDVYVCKEGALQDRTSTGSNSLGNRSLLQEQVSIDMNDDRRELSNYASTSTSRKELMLKQWEGELGDVGQVFDDAVQFRLCLQKYAMAHHFEFNFVRNDKNYIKARCVSESCPWYINLSAVGEKNFIVSKFVNDHDHTVSSEFSMNRKVSKGLVGELFYETLRFSPSYTPVQMVKDFKRLYDIDLPYKQAWNGKEVAKEILHGKLDDSYVRLPWYCRRIVESNPGSVAFVEMDNERRFHRCFVSFAASVDGFRQKCRRILFIDGTHLKARFKGTLLSASAADAANGLFPVAFAVVSGETYEDWGWFLRTLKGVLAMGEDIVIVSDRHPNIISSVEEVFKKELHSYCLHHIEANVLAHLVKLKVSANIRELVKDQIWKIARASLAIDYDRCMDELKKMNEEAHKYLMSSEPAHWATSKFPVRRYNMLTSNHAECYNNWIKAAREMPILFLVDAIRKKCMDRHHKRFTSKWRGKVGRKVGIFIRKTLRRATKFTLFQSSADGYEVHGDEMLGHYVDMGGKTCSCQEWYYTGLPCPHACAVMKKYRLDPTLYVEECYTEAVQKSIYEKPLTPMETWDMPTIIPDPFLEPVADIRPPTVRRPPGRPKKARIESQRGIVRDLRCSACGEVGHNRKTCRERHGPPESLIIELASGV